MSVSFGWFSTGRDREAIDLLEEVQRLIQLGFIKGRIDFVFCNRESAEDAESDKFIDAVNKFGIDLICFSSRKFKPQKQRNFKEQWRREYDREIIKLIGHRQVDWVVLAGYMLIVSDVLCKKFKMINLHPALPGGPKGTWQEVIWRIIEEEKSETGAMIHLVTEELDAGPAISYFSFPIRGKDFQELWFNFKQKSKKKSFDEIKFYEGEREPLFKKIREEEFKREIPLLICTLKKIADKEIDVNMKSQILINGEVSEGPLCLNDLLYGFIKKEEIHEKR